MKHDSARCDLPIGGREATSDRVMEYDNTSS